MLARIAACAIVIAASAASPASAAIWAWGCKGQLGDLAVVYTSDKLIVAPAKTLQIKLRDLGVSNPSVEADDGVTFTALGGGGGFEKTVSFKHGDDQKLILTEMTSRKISERKGRVGPRDEYTTIFKKTYDYALTGQPTQRLSMDCIEYMLSTKGGRQ